MKILHSGLPIFMRDTDSTLSFEQGLICDGSSSKTVGQMEGLIRNPNMSTWRNECTKPTAIFVFRNMKIY